MAIGFSNVYKYNIDVTRIIKGLDDAGIILVASVGNEGDKNCVDFPANIECVYSVGSIKQYSSQGYCLSDFSNSDYENPDLVAPGEKIVVYNFVDSRWVKKVKSGSSYSAAIVSAQIQYNIDKLLSLNQDTKNREYVINSKNKLVYAIKNHS